MWQVGALVNLVTMVAYVAIVAAIAIPLVRERQVRANALGTATALIFLTCAVHHGSIAIHSFLPTVGWASATGAASRAGVDITTVVWDVVTAGVGVYYWSLRRTYGELMKGAKLFDDLKERQRQALEINDTIVQGLATAKMSLELDQATVTREVLESTLGAARNLITDLLGEVSASTTFGPGELRRSQAAISTGHG